MVEELPNPCKVGIFGTGPLVRALLPHIKRNFEVVAIWDADDSELEEEAESLNISIYSSHEDDVLLNKDIGLLIILCPPIHHAQIAVKALGTFKHVYVHPPCATNAPQTLRMVQSAAYYPNLVAVVGSLRSMPAVAEMKRLIDDGFLGSEIIHCDLRLQSPPLVQNRYSWKCSEDMGGGVLNYFGSHVLDLIVFLLGQKASRVNAVFRTVQKRNLKIGGIRHITADDVASLAIETEANCLVTINLSSQATSFSQELTVTGNEGQLILRNSNLYGRKLMMDNSQAEDVLFLDTLKNNSKIEDDIKEEIIPEVYLQAYAKLFDGLKSTLTSNNDNKHLLATFEDALHVSEIIWAARQSFIEKSWCRVISGIAAGEK